MRKFRLALCDDEHFFIEDIKQYLKAYESETNNEIVVTEYYSGIELLEDIRANGLTWDILFLDVDMPQKSGTEVAKEIRRNYENAVICFITAYVEYAYQAYQTEALGYLVKPVKYSELRHLLNRSVTQVQYMKDAAEARKRYIEIKTNHNTTILCMEEILYIEKRRNQCVFHLEDGEMVCYMTLKEVYKKLDHEIFYYVHQGYIVNFEQIKEVRADVVCLGRNREVPMSRRYQSKMREMHMNKIRHIQMQRKSFLE